MLNKLLYIQVYLVLVLVLIICMYTHLSISLWWLDTLMRISYTQVCVCVGVCEGERTCVCVCAKCARMCVCVCVCLGGWVPTIIIHTTFWGIFFQLIIEENHFLKIIQIVSIQIFYTNISPWEQVQHPIQTVIQS